MSYRLSRVTVSDTNPACRKVLRAKVFHLAGKLDAAPGDAITWYGLGIALEKLGDRAGALLALRNALMHDAGHPPTHLALGRLLFECGQVEEALRYFAAVSSRPIQAVEE